MKYLFLMACLVGAPAFAAETIGEEAAATAHNVKRKVKKGAHRVGEKMCAQGDAACLGKKIKNRAGEAKESVEDKASEVKNKID